MEIQIDRPATGSVSYNCFFPDLLLLNVSCDTQWSKF